MEVDHGLESNAAFNDQQVLTMCVDWAQIAYREAMMLVGTTEFPTKMAECKRYQLLARRLASLIKRSESNPDL